MTFPRHACARLDVPPEVPTVPDFVPANIELLNKQLNAGLAEAAKQWAKVLNSAGIRAE